MQQTLSGRASALYTLLCQEYARRGYIHSGSVSLDLATSRLGVSQEVFYGALSEIMAASLVQQCRCKGIRWELTVLARYRLLIAYRLSEQWQQQAPYFYPNGPRGEVERVVEEITQLCHELAEALVQRRTAPSLTCPDREASSIVFPLNARRAHQLFGPKEEQEVVEHILDVLQAYAAEKILDVLKSAPIERFADDVADRFINVTRFDRMPQWKWRTGRWVVTCLFAPQDHWIDRPCIVRATPVSLDPDGSKTRVAAEKWRSFAASVIRDGIKAHQQPHELGEATPKYPRGGANMG